MIPPRLLFIALLPLAPAAAAADGFSLGIGTDYTRGDYGSGTTTEIVSIPVTARIDSGNWSLHASLPWLHVEGDPDVLPSVGPVDNLNPLGRGRGGLLGGEPPTGATERGSASGIGDLILAATYSLPTGNALGVDLSANAKIATADEDRSLGTGANDYGVAIDLYRDFGGTLLFGGAGYTRLGDSRYIEVDGVLGGNLGISRQAGKARIGVMYDYREAAADGYDDRRDVTGFLSTQAGANGRFQFHLSQGLTDGGPDWGAGTRFVHTF